MRGWSSWVRWLVQAGWLSHEAQISNQMLLPLILMGGWTLSTVCPCHCQCPLLQDCHCLIWGCFLRNSFAHLIMGKSTVAPLGVCLPFKRTWNASEDFCAISQCLRKSSPVLVLHLDAYQGLSWASQGGCLLPWASKVTFTLAQVLSWRGVSVCFLHKSK